MKPLSKTDRDYLLGSIEWAHDEELDILRDEAKGLTGENRIKHEKQIRKVVRRYKRLVDLVPKLFAED